MRSGYIGGCIRDPYEGCIRGYPYGGCIRRPYPTIRSPIESFW